MPAALDFPKPALFKRKMDRPVDIGMTAGGILGYLLAWTGLVCLLYLQHWMAGGLGALTGGLFGWLLFRIRNKSKAIAHTTKIKLQGL